MRYNLIQLRYDLNKKLELTVQKDAQERQYYQEYDKPIPGNTVFWYYPVDKYSEEDAIITFLWHCIYEYQNKVVDIFELMEKMENKR